MEEDYLELKAAAAHFAKAYDEDDQSVCRTSSAEEDDEVSIWRFCLHVFCCRGDVTRDKPHSGYRFFRFLFVPAFVLLIVRFLLCCGVLILLSLVVRARQDKQKSLYKKK